MTTMTLAVPSELKHKMENFPEMNWSEVARKAFKQKIKDLELFEKFFDLFERNVILVPKEEIELSMIEAEKISPDKKDVLYFALALKLKCGIWSNDKKLKTQNKVKVYSTEDLLKEI